MSLRRLMVAGLVGLIAMMVVPSVWADDDDPDRGHPERIPTYLPQRFASKPAGTKEHQRWWFGPYTVPPGHDMNRVDVDIPVENGFITSVAPHIRRAADITEPPHQESHIHHAHWFSLDPGNKEDQYFSGNAEWIFGTGDEESHAEFQPRADADPKGPLYGQYIGGGNLQPMIYMLHNKTSLPQLLYIVLDVDFIHGNADQVKQATGREIHDLKGVLFGRTFDVPRVALGDGIFSTSKMKQGPIEWVSTMDGTIIGTGGHLHPGGLGVVVENLGPKDNPCPDTSSKVGGTGGTLLVNNRAHWRYDIPFSEDFVMEGTQPAWRAPIHKGDRIRITGQYENKDHAWYTAMTHEGWFVDPQQAPVGRCAPYLINQPTPKGRMTRVRKVVHKWVRKKVTVKRHGHKRKVWKRVRISRVKWVHKMLPGKPQDPTEGYLMRPFGNHADQVCGREYGKLPCERPDANRPPGQFTTTVTINNFIYTPGDMSVAGSAGDPVQVHKGQSLTFINDDESADIRHSVTTCAAPCNGPYVANYPLADGRWDSGTLGYDLIDGGNPNPMSSTPADLPEGRYTYFCRIHPWMRGEFDVVP